jgi:hypothetical protein
MKLMFPWLLPGKGLGGRWVQQRYCRPHPKSSILGDFEMEKESIERA